MKILIIRPFPEKINIDSYNVQEIGLAKALAQKGHECGIVFFESSKASSEQSIRVENGQDIHIFWCNGINLFKNGLFFGIRNLINEYEIIQVHEYDQLYSWYLYSFCKKPVVVYHGPYYNAFNKRYNLKTSVFDRLFLNNKNTAKATVLTKSDLAALYLKSKGFRNVKSVGVGLDTSRLIKEEASVDVVKIIDYISGFDSFLYVGKIEERRNILFLLDVFAEVNKDKSSKLVLVGKGEEDYVKKVRAKISSLHIDDAVIWVDKLAQSQLPHLYTSCKYFLFATEYDIFGMVLLEAMYYGMIVFSSLNGGSSTLIKSEYNGIVFDCYDKTVWANKIKEVQKMDCSAIGMNAKDTIISKFLWTSLADDFINTYEECIEKYKNIKG